MRAIPRSVGKLRRTGRMLFSLYTHLIRKYSEEVAGYGGQLHAFTCLRSKFCPFKAGSR